ncbi:MAG: nitrophenyl compound nitroreductase subunit ArsF family protein [candidate division Zixibacteria bacterium]|nr:nitrophenyl compound nitroreductase subunit ArsF family protein [candidate division Zixibacteria bacterium]
MKSAVFNIMLIVMSVLCASAENSPEVPPVKDTDTATMTGDSVNPDSSESIVDKIIVYYFHGTRRCSNCVKFENYTKETLDSGFAGEIESGLLEWRQVDTDESENKHFINDYQLFTKAVVLSRVIKGKEAGWKNLDKIWEYVGNKEKFMSYIKDEINTFLKEK